MKARLRFTFFRVSTAPDRNPIDEIVALLSDKPDEVARKGDPERYRKYHVEDSISYKIKEFDCFFIEDEIDALVDRMITVKPVLDEHLGDYCTELAICCYSDGQVNPEVVIKPETTAKLGTLRAKLWADIYCTPGN